MKIRKKLLVDPKQTVTCFYATTGISQYRLISVPPIIMQTVHWSVNSVYESENKEQLRKYYHASLGSHTRQTLYTATKACYLQ